MSTWISVSEAFESLMGPEPAVLVDVRRPDVITASGVLFPATSFIADQMDAPKLAAVLRPLGRVIVACAHGHNRSQLFASLLDGEGVPAAILRDGMDGWQAAGLPLVRRVSDGLATPITLGGEPTMWVTRQRPKIDRVACPWLIRRVLDPRARFLFAEPDCVLTIAEQTGAIPYDLPGAALEHDDPHCTFDTMLRAFGLAHDPSLSELATIVRAADTDRLDLHPAAAGLLAVALGLSDRHGDDDLGVLRDGFTLYDGLYSWVRHARCERHEWPRTTTRLEAEQAA